MIRHLEDITPVSTSHAVGRKRVLLSSNESGCSLTQIAVTELRAGEVAVAHVHPDMQEGFYVLSGELEIVLDGQHTICPKDTFVYVEKCTSHELRPITDVRIMTIGCVIEAYRNKYYPLLFKQNRKTLVWGTEDWTVSAVPGSESEIENGTWARYRLDEVILKHPAEFLGKQTAAKCGNKLPLLTKIIDADQDLSIQVHPNDEMALREHGKTGKSEMWYILDAEPGAYLYAGFKQQITPEEYTRLVQEAQDGTPPFERGLVGVLAKHEVHKGDVFYLPAGRVHAICGGIRLAEVQQSSDVTYRIFDYNRPGLDGRPRELHTELAAKAIDYQVYPEYKTEPVAKSPSIDELLNTPYFSINVIETAHSEHRNMIRYDSFIILMNITSSESKDELVQSLPSREECRPKVNLGDACKIRIRATGDEIILPPDTSCLIPAVIADYEIIGKAKILEAFINNRKSIGKIISDFFHMN